MGGGGIRKEIPLVLPVSRPGLGSPAGGARRGGSMKLGLQSRMTVLVSFLDLDQWACLDLGAAC